MSSEAAPVEPHAPPDAQLGGSGSKRSSAPATEVPAVSGRCHPLLVSFLTLWLIAFTVWLISAGKRYREEYAQATEGWLVGTARTVELTLVRNDKRNLACASDAVVADLHCGYRRNFREADSSGPDDPHIVQPYNTVGNELLLGAGLWNSPDLLEPPQSRFTVVCNYHIRGVMRSALIRFGPNVPFEPIGKTVTIGTLADCMIPR